MSKLNVDFGKAVSHLESMMNKRLLVKTVLYKRIFGGKGLDFDTYRNYVPFNDDASLIDWKATMRNAGKPLLRQYVEERDLKIFFIIDVGDNMVLGSGQKLKNEITAEICSALAHLILISGDSVGFALYGQNVKKVIMPSAGMKQYNNLTRQLIDSGTYGGKSNLKQTLTFLLPRMKNINAVFLITDFLNLDEKSLSVLKTFSEVYETIGISIRDPVDESMPDISGEVVIEDIYTGEQKTIDPKLIKRQYELAANKQKQEIRDLFKKTGSDLLEINTNHDYLSSLASFLSLRTKKTKFKK